MSERKPECDCDWRRYYDQTGRRAPRQTLLFALDRFAAESGPGARRRAVDLGCGNGRDTIELLSRGWAVIAIDTQPSAIAGLRERPDRPAGAELDARLGRFEDLEWPEVDLVNAGFSLPLCPPEKFDRLWARIVASLRPGGRFAGQLYGDRDGWAGDATLTHRSRAAVEAMLAGLAVELFEEEEEDSVTPRGKAKHWHIFHIVVRTPPAGAG